MNARLINRNVTAGLIALFCFTALGCNLGSVTRSYRNKKGRSDTARATFNLTNIQSRTLVVLSLSGGGSRAAFFSAVIMQHLHRLKILQHTTVISSVSGGSIPAAYYALTGDVKEIDTKMAAAFLKAWERRCLYPSNMCLYWSTDFDRGDILGETLEAEAFPTKWFGPSTFSDLKKEMPVIILNSTYGVVERDLLPGPTYRFDEDKDWVPNLSSKIFTFTQEDFNSIDSDLGAYPVSRAVAASATFPGPFNYHTLRDFRKTTESYIHTFDGGVADNLGLTTVKNVLLTNNSKFDRVLVVLVDAYTKEGGVSVKQSDPRSEIADYVVDSGVFDAFDRLIDIQRNQLIQNFQAKFCSLPKCSFVQLNFDMIGDKDIRTRAHQIPTSFNISLDNQNVLRDAAKFLLLDPKTPEAASALATLTEFAKTLEQSPGGESTPAGARSPALQTSE